MHQGFELYYNVHLFLKLWFEKFVFFKGRRQNKGPLPVDFDDLHAFLGVSQDFRVFSFGFSKVSFKSWRSSSAPLSDSHLFSSGFSMVSQGTVPADFQFVSVCLFPIYACVSMILKLENGQQNVDLSSGNFL